MSAAAPPLGQRGERWLQLVLPVVSVATVLSLWEVAPRLGWVRRTVMPTFSETLTSTLTVVQHPAFIDNLRDSASRWVAGFAIAIVLGITVGILMGRSKVLFNLIDPILTVTYPVPRAALILILVLWFGIGAVSMVGIIVLGSIIPLVISSYHGAQGVNPHLLWSARALGTNRRAVLFKIVLPAALPQILSGLRIAIAISIFTMLASELLVRQSGIGAFLFTNWDHGHHQVVWATSLVLATIGFLLDFFYVRGIRLVLPWLEGEV